MIRLTLAATAALLATPALAGPQPDDVPTASVRTADLDLSGDAGRATFRDRVKRAASLACGTPEMRDLTGVRQARACRVAMRSDADRQLLALTGRAPEVRVVAANTATVPPARR